VHETHILECIHREIRKDTEAAALTQQFSPRNFPPDNPDANSRRLTNE